jgi:hypothetical protein
MAIKIIYPQDCQERGIMYPESGQNVKSHIINLGVAVVIFSKISRSCKAMFSGGLAREFVKP